MVSWGNDIVSFLRKAGNRLDAEQTLREQVLDTRKKALADIDSLLKVIQETTNDEAISVQRAMHWQRSLDHSVRIQEHIQTIRQGKMGEGSCSNVDVAEKGKGKQKAKPQVESKSKGKKGKGL